MEKSKHKLNIKYFPLFMQAKNYKLNSAIYVPINWDSPCFVLFKKIPYCNHQVNYCNYELLSSVCFPKCGC